MFGQRTHTGEPPDVGFDKRRIGLDHVAFACTTDELEFWRDRLDELGIALEFFAPPG